MDGTRLIFRPETGFSVPKHWPKSTITITIAHESRAIVLTALPTLGEAVVRAEVRTEPSRRRLSA